MKVCAVIWLIFASASLLSARDNAPVDTTTPSAPPPQSPSCTKNVSFGVFVNGQVVLAEPGWIADWLRKNSKKYSGACFLQSPMAGVANFLMVLTTSSEILIGFDPVVRTNTTTSTTPVSGNGTVRDSYGGFWTYTYNGTVTTMTTTTTQENAEYSLKSNTLYIYTFYENGALVGNRWQTLTTKQGGDPYNTLGNNHGTALAAINFKSRLLKNAMDDLCGPSKCN
jgi:hypothetical protein